jgi:hypothetical protein
VRLVGISALCFIWVSLSAAKPWADPSPASASAADRYVSADGNDSNPGSASRPWRTIQLAAKNSVAGMTIHVAPGTYRVSALSGEKASIDSSASGTASSHITFISDQQWGAKIVSSADTIWTNSGAYVDIVGFDMSGGGTTYTGIHSQGNYARSIGNRIHDFGSTGCVSGAGIMIGGMASNQSAIANIIYNLGPLPPAIPGCNQIHGIYAQEYGSVVVNNITFNIAGKGLHIWGDRPSHVIVANNTSFHNQDGMVVGNDGCCGTNFDDSLISNNILYDNVRYGIYESNSVGMHNQYLNNLIYANPAGTSMITGELKRTIAASPQFVNYTGTISGDYHLKSSSPAIHAGAAAGAPSTDLDSKSRGSAPDVGAYQFSARTNADSGGHCSPGLTGCGLETKRR